MIVKSIRVRLLIWYAVVLSGVVVGFAGLLYWEYRVAKFAAVDAVLESGAAGLDAAMRLFPPVELLSKDRVEPLPPKGKGPPPPPKVANREQLVRTLGWPGGPETQGDHQGRYFVIWRADHSVLKSVGIDPVPAWPNVTHPAATIRMHGGVREMVLLGPRETVILVGMPIAHVERELRTFAWQLVLTGSLVLLVGLSGGWWISRRIIRPVERIAATASQISGDNLTQRIDTTAVETELAGLANVLNATFDRLQEAFDRQTQFTADASHELRTPLAVLRSQAELTLSRPRTDAEYRQALEASLRATVRMTELVEKMLLLARADRGANSLTMESVEWDAIVQDVVGQLTPLADKKGITLHAGLDPVTVRGDAVALAQIASNLISNAIQYNRPNGRVDIRLRRRDTDAELLVRDTGLGIPETDLPHIFERFYRVDQARTRSSGGTGLGLAICQNYVIAHGGEISVESTPNQGTTFWVYLPCCRSQPEPK